jgi:hypothetical protein
VEGLIDVAIGTGSKTKTFQVPKASLYRQSTYFSKKECTGIIVLEDLDPVSFALFCQWVHKPAKPIEYWAEGYTEETWISNAAAAWVLAKKLRAPRFEKYALSQFIQNCVGGIRALGSTWRKCVLLSLRYDVSATIGSHGTFTSLADRGQMGTSVCAQQLCRAR